MPQWLTDIEAQQRIDDYGSYNDISRQSKIMCIKALMI
jgi:hypothetical protein